MDKPKISEEYKKKFEKYKKDIDRYLNIYFLKLNNFWVTNPLCIITDNPRLITKILSYKNIINDVELTNDFSKQYNEEYKIFNDKMKILSISLKPFFDKGKMNDFGCKNGCYNTQFIEKNKKYITEEYGMPYSIYIFNTFIDIITKNIIDYEQITNINSQENYIYKKIILIYLYIIIRLILFNTTLTFTKNFYDFIKDIQNFISLNYKIKLIIAKRKDDVINKCNITSNLNDLLPGCNELYRGIFIDIENDIIYLYNNNEDGIINFSSQLQQQTQIKQEQIKQEPPPLKIPKTQGGNNYKEKYLKYKLKYLNLKNKY